MRFRVPQSRQPEDRGFRFGLAEIFRTFLAGSLRRRIITLGMVAVVFIFIGLQVLNHNDTLVREDAALPTVLPWPTFTGNEAVPPCPRVPQDWQHTPQGQLVPELTLTEMDQLGVLAGTLHPAGMARTWAHLEAAILYDLLRRSMFGAQLRSPLVIPEADAIAASENPAPDVTLAPAPEWQGPAALVSKMPEGPALLAWAMLGNRSGDFATINYLRPVRGEGYLVFDIEITPRGGVPTGWRYTFVERAGQWALRCAWVVSPPEPK